MRTSFKKRAMILLAGASVLALGGACLCMNAPVAYAAEESTYCAFYNVGANDDAKEIDAALGLEQKGVSATAAGEVTEGGTVFDSYATNPTYEVTLSGADSYRVAVIVKSGATVTIGGTSVTPAGEGENRIATATVSASPVTVAVTGKACAVLADDAAGAPTLMALEYTNGQVIPYGALLEDVLDNATGYYSNGKIEEVEIKYGEINGGTGVNVNFSTVDVEGTIAGTELSITRYITTMPDNLVYFINSGSYDHDGLWPLTSDPYYSYNWTVFDYYKNGSGALLNDGTPDRKAPSSNEWGWYGNSADKVTYTAPDNACFPYSSDLCMARDDTAMLGYYLTGLSSSTQYRIWIGTLSPWHARTVNITFNGKVVGADNLRINASKGFTVFEGVTPDASGKIDINMKGASTNEPCASFIAVQKMDTEVAAVPAALTGGPTIDTADKKMTVYGVTEGTKLQMYNALKPNQIIYEEMVDSEKIGPDGEYELNWGRTLDEISQFNVVQITSGGMSAPLLISITDIKFVGDGIASKKIAWVVDEAYTTDSVTIKVAAEASSGIASWSYRLGEYGRETAYKLDRPYSLDTSFTATENGDYYVVVSSGLGVTYTQIVTVTNIDPNAPVIAITPSYKGWKESSYNVNLAVTSIAPVVEYKLFKNGAQIGTTAETAPAEVKFTETGEYVIFVKTAAGRTATSAFLVSDKPTVTKVSSKYASRTLTYTFGDTDDYKVASISAYQILASSTSRMTISSGNSMNVYNAGTYVVTVKTTTGTVEVFSFTVSQSELKPVNNNANGGVAGGLGIGIGVGVGGIVIAAVAIVLTLVLLKKKQPAKSAVTEEVVAAKPSTDTAEDAESVDAEESADADSDDEE